MSITTNGERNGRAFIGVDVGGTHTDVSIVYEGTVQRGKALTTYDDFSRGVLEAVDVAAANYELSLEQMLGRTQLFINGTTVVTNAIAQLRGSRVGAMIKARGAPGGPMRSESPSSWVAMARP